MHRTAIALLTMIPILAGCTPGVSTPTPDLDATLEVRMQQTREALPTATLLPSSTPTTPPTRTPLPTDTPQPTPSSASSQPYTAETLNNGWSRYSYPDQGFVIAVPPAWEVITLSPEAYARAAEANPQLTKYYSVQTIQNMIASGIKFLAVDLSQASLSGGAPNNLNLLIAGIPQGVDLWTYLDSTEASLKQLLGADLEISRNRASLAEHEAGLLTYETTINNTAGDSVPVVFHQYLTLIDGEQIVLTLLSEQNTYSDSRSVFEDIASTFQYNK